MEDQDAIWNTEKLYGIQEANMECQQAFMEYLWCNTVKRLWNSKKSMERKGAIVEHQEACMEDMEYQEAFMEYLLCNSLKRSWNTKKVDGTQRSYCGIPRS